MSECLYALDEPRVFFPREWCETASRARYRGWKELDAVGMWDEPFYPPDWQATKSYAYRYTADEFAELTHNLTNDPMIPGAFPVWVVEYIG